MRHRNRRERESEELRSKILDAARELFATEGYARVSMRKIADRIEYSPTTIYHYFENKEAIVSQLLAEIYAEFYGTLQRRYDELMEAGADLPARLLLVCREYVEYGITHPEHYDLLFVSDLEGASRSRLDKNDRLNGFNMLRDSIEEAIGQDLLDASPDESADMIAKSAWSVLHGLTSTLIRFPGSVEMYNVGPDAVSPEDRQMIDFTLRRYFRSLLRPGTALPEL
ncbi:TetR/AcrR family transcriptional regulator [Saccharibacillus sp. CPCC 101409]|uniref:TetR/AcrR family transcriptional regulator n=1 Tax=Saccharibacillus sp. CPCC 101409 TaxID=3058041 RepID=UPI002672C3AF|nr:TetR/AcrR family transcriptional regulator [Saccharibacillus sp. CPCC 101409]MDO3408173.1 TetR/AcrR family transcriptional regulator [Saccharibacillus sp. CPCC 101409]